MTMCKVLCLMAVLLSAGAVQAQTAVTGVDDHEKLLASSDPKLAANKRLVYDFWREVFDAGDAQAARKYLGEPYIQHNPNAENGIDSFVNMLGKWRQPQPVQARVKIPIVSIIAEGDMVMFAFVKELTDPKDASKKYTTTGIDIFRIKDGKIVEHWDPYEKRDFNLQTPAR